MKFLKLYEQFESNKNLELYKHLTEVLPNTDHSFDNSSNTFTNPEMIKEQWIIHTTNDADNILNNGFKYGTTDMNKLGTTFRIEKDKKVGTGYTFGYTLEDFKNAHIYRDEDDEDYDEDEDYFENDEEIGQYKYGNDIILVKTDGITELHSHLL